jgi:hypothetical protein
MGASREDHAKEGARYEVGYRGGNVCGTLLLDMLSGCDGVFENVDKVLLLAYDENDV